VTVLRLSYKDYNISRFMPNPVENLKTCIIIVKPSCVSMTAAAAAAAVKLHPIGARQAPQSAVHWPLTSPWQI